MLLKTIECLIEIWVSNAGWDRQQRVSINMGSIKQAKGRKSRSKSRLRHHKRSVVAISGVIALMSVMVLFGGMKLQARNRAYKVQEAELQAQLDDEKARSEEIDELKEYIGTDAYIEEVAKEKLGLVHENEILFKPEQ